MMRSDEEAVDLSADASFHGATRFVLDVRDDEVRGLALDPELAPILLRPFGFRFD